MWVSGGLQVHGICSRNLLLRFDQTIRQLGMIDNYYIDHQTFNIITIWEHSFIMNKNNQKPINLFSKQDVTVYLTYIKKLED